MNVRCNEQMITNTQNKQYAFFVREEPSKKVEVLHEQEGLLTLVEAADRLRVAPATLRRWVKKGRIEAIKLPKRTPYVYIRKTVVDAILTPF